MVAEIPPLVGKCVNIMVAHVTKYLVSSSGIFVKGRLCLIALVLSLYNPNSLLDFGHMFVGTR